MDINLKVATSRLFPNSKFEMIYFEAIANALDANATQIDIEIEYKDSQFSQFTIIDNGCGLNEENYQRFSELMEAKDNAHKGQGRLVYLIYFEKIEITSQFYHENNTYRRNFVFNYDFDKSHGLHFDKLQGNHATGTRLSFSGKLKDLSKLKSISADGIKEEILAEFLPCFYQMKQEQKPFIINIKSKIKEEEIITRIDVSDIPQFKCCEIPTVELMRNELNGELFQEPISYLYYSITQAEIPSIVTSFSIDNRATKLEIFDKSNYFPNIEAIFFLVSKHFEGCIDPTRQELKLEPVEREQVETTLKRYIKDILKTNNKIEYEENIQKQSDFVGKRFPHLLGYVNDEELGFQSTEKVIQIAQNKFFREQFKILKKDKVSEDDYETIINLSARNLTEYILFRQLQIDALLAISKKDEEKTIHNLISPMKQIMFSDSKHQYLFSDNAWILDDRFMSYLHSTSDVSLQKITQSFNNIFYQESESEERPDYLMFFSNKLENPNDKVNMVCFEFKKLGNTKYDKAKAIIQLTDYAVELKETCKQIEMLFLFALVEFDEKFEKTLKGQGFRRRFSLQGKIWSKYNPDVDVELSFLDFKALIHDANSRNKTFMEILKKGFSYNNEDE